jgi:hypothetical protein
MAKRNKTRRKLEASLGDSWDEANLSADGDASTAYHSEIELEPSDNELVQAQDIISPPARQQLSSSKSGPKGTTSSTQESHDDSFTPRPPRAAQPMTASEQTGPSFIMPKLESSLHSTTGSPSRRSQVRSKMVRNKTPHLRTSDRSTTSYNPSAVRIKPDSEPAAQQPGPAVARYLGLFFENFVSPVFRYSFGVLGHAMRNLQPLLGLIMAVLVLIFAIQWAVGSFRSGLTMALSPVCIIPGSSRIIPFCAAQTYDDPRVDFEGLLNAQTGLEDILDAAKDTSTLPSTIKDSEIAIRDLRTLVRHSRLPSRHQLDLEFENFVLTASEASMDLSRFNSRIGATVDRIIATNTWTRAVLSDISEQEASYSAVDRVYGALTSPFVAPPPTLQERIFDQYSLHVAKNTEEITKLINTAVALLSVLQNLDHLPNRHGRRHNNHQKPGRASCAALDQTRWKQLESQSQQ